MTTKRIKLAPARYSRPWFIFRNGWKYYSRHGWEVKLMELRYTYGFYYRQYILTFVVLGFEMEIRWDRLPLP